MAENGIWPDSRSVMGETDIIMEVSIGTILYEKNMHDIHYPASITKIMTALLAIENCEMDEIVTVLPEAVYMEDKGSHIALDEGEQLPVEQCLYAIMPASANDAALLDESHVTSAYDMALITKFNMYNHHKMIGKTEFQNEEVFDGKNGYTDVAGHTLVTCANRDDMVIICVVMQDQGEYIYRDTLELLNYGLDGFSKEEM